MIRTVAVVTRDRLPSLRRTLVSYAAVAKAFGRTLDFVVADDARSAESREATRAGLRALAREHGIRVYYAGEEEKRRYATVLARESGVAAPVIELALFGVGPDIATAGANHNWILLQTVGERFFGSDDDVECRVLRSPDIDATGGLLVTDDGEREGFGPPADFFWRLFPDLDAAIRHTRDAAIDPFAEHERLLGEPVASVARAFPGPVAGSRPAGDDGSTVMVTMNGLVGDAGTAEPWHVTAGLPELVELRRSEQAYRQSFASRVVVRTARRCTITRHVGFHAFAYAADNRELLPPFFPVFRREDTLFGATWRRTHPHARFGFLPWAFIHHAPDRAYAPVERLLSSHDLAEVIADLLPPVSPRLVSADAALRQMGEALIDVGSASPADLAERVSARWRRGRPWFQDLLRRARRNRDAPPHWVRDLERIERTDRELRAQYDGTVPFDVLRARPDPVEARELTRMLIRGFGEMLVAWSVIRSAAALLRFRGERTAVAIE